MNGFWIVGWKLMNGDSHPLHFDCQFKSRSEESKSLLEASFSERKLNSDESHE